MSTAGMSAVPTASPARTMNLVNVSEVNLAPITDIITSIGGLFGCRTCGLLGFDLDLSGDPGSLPEGRNRQSVRVN